MVQVTVLIIGEKKLIGFNNKRWPHACFRSTTRTPRTRIIRNRNESILYMHITVLIRAHSRAMENIKIVYKRKVCMF